MRCILTHNLLSPLGQMRMIELNSLDFSRVYKGKILLLCFSICYYVCGLSQSAHALWAWWVSCWLVQTKKLVSWIPLNRSNSMLTSRKDQFDSQISGQYIIFLQVPKRMRNYHLTSTGILARVYHLIENSTRFLGGKGYSREQIV